MTQRQSRYRCPDCNALLEDVRDVAPDGWPEPIVGGDCDRCNEFHQVSEGHAGIA